MAPTNSIPVATIKEIENILYEEYDYRDDNGDLDYEILVESDQRYAVRIETHCDDYSSFKGETGWFWITMLKNANGKWEIRG